MDILIDDRYSGMLIRELLVRELRYSSNMIKRLKFRENGIRVNGEFVTVRHRLEKGELLQLKVEDGAEDVSPYNIPVDISLDILYEDKYITAVNKPPFMPTHPSLGHKTDTLSNALSYRYRDVHYVFRPVNRLDRDTSGCVLTANSSFASYRMYRSMVEKKISKRYMAVVCGGPEKDEGMLTGYLKREDGSVIRRCSTTADDPEGKPAVTVFRTIFRKDGFAVLELEPKTGRTHQLRVQLAGAGFPITGDTMYGTESPLIPRQALHCFATSFPHPETDEMISLYAQPSDDIIVCMKKLFGENDTAWILAELKEKRKCDD